jgi:hypothetical protein
MFGMRVSRVLEKRPVEPQNRIGSREKPDDAPLDLMYRAPTLTPFIFLSKLLANLKNEINHLLLENG